MVRIASRTLWVAACFAGLMITVDETLAQYPQQNPQQSAAQGLQAQQTDRSRYIPPGYVRDMNMYWRPMGRPPEVLRPLPPGVVSTFEGDHFEPMPAKWRGYSRYHRVKGYPR